MDAPEHHRHRGLVSSAFRHSTLARWEHSLIRRIVNDLIDQFIDDGRADLVDEYTFPFPARVIAGVLGLPEDHYLEFQRWAIGIIGVTNDYQGAVESAAEFTRYLFDIVEARRNHPRDDLVTDLVTVELDGDNLDDEEIYSFLRMLLPAGIETTYRSSGNLLYRLLTHPDQLEAVRSDRSLVPQAVEEGLRYETPVLAAWRLVTTDTSLCGVDLPAGSIVMLMLGSANRDTEAYDDPEVFDISRTPKQHLSFGTGPHLCLGIPFARMQTRLALNALFDRLPNLRLDLEAAQRLDAHIDGDLMFRGPTHVPVVWH
jgi:cytochrome P450